MSFAGIKPLSVTYDASALVLRAGHTSATDLLSPEILRATRTLGIPIGLQAGLLVSSPSDSLENRDEGGYQAPS